MVERSCQHWQGYWNEAGFHDYDSKIPLVFTTIDALRNHGPAAVFQRAGRYQPQTCTRRSATLATTRFSR